MIEKVLRRWLTLPYFFVLSAALALYYFFTSSIIF